MKVFDLKTRNLAALLGEINEEAKLKLPFILLTIFSCLIATLGLHLNNASVVIGAMIIALLMQPLLAISIEGLTGDLDNLKGAVITISVGIITSILISALVSLIINSPEPTAEIIARTKPNLLDLGVAIFAGATGAYVRSQEKLAQTIGGVAIAVALMPPLCVVGYEIAHHDINSTIGSALLFITNLNGILLASCITFFIFGYHRFIQTWKWFVSTALVTALIVVPLSFSLVDLYKESKLKREVKQVLKKETKTFKRIEIVEVRVTKFLNPTEVTAVIRGDGQSIAPYQVMLIENLLKDRTKENITFSIEVIPTLSIMSGEF